MGSPEINNPSQPPQQPPQKQAPVLLICPWCFSIHVSEREATVIYPPTYHANKLCLKCGDVPLLLFGITPGSWGDPKVREVGAGEDQ